MDIRAATPDDADTLRSIAQRSMEASYPLSPAAIRAAIDRWYDADALDEKFADDDVFFLLVEVDGEPAAFAESVRVDDHGDVLWLHVDPMFRGQEIGERLFEETRARLREAGAETVRGLVLADNVEGNAFYEDQGLTKAGESTVTIDGEEHIENIYVEPESAGLEPLAGPDDRQLYIDRDDFDRGADAPFHVVYSDPDRRQQYAYFCGNCESLVTTMDSMGGMECDQCGNRRKPTRWDAAYM